MPMMVGLIKSARLSHHTDAVNVDAGDGGSIKVSKAFASHMQSSALLSLLESTRLSHHTVTVNVDTDDCGFISDLVQNEITVPHL